MNRKEFDRQMRSREINAGYIAPGGHVVVRLDGRGFSALTEQHYAKPFDMTFTSHMYATAQKLVDEFGARLAYVQSDEISLLLPIGFDLFGRRSEKLVTVAAGVASSAFTLRTARMAAFDARLWCSDSLVDLTDYFCWRQADAARNALNSGAYWFLRNRGDSARRADSALRQMSADQKRQMLEEAGKLVPLWASTGAVIRPETYIKTGWNPMTGIVCVERRRTVVDEAIPVDGYFRDYIIKHA